MTARATPLSGGCLCGAVRFTLQPKSRDIGVCHCSMCRRWAAGPFFAIECEGAVELADATDLGVYRSSEWAERCFCKRCGSALFYRLVGKGFSAVSAEALDDHSGFRFATQIFIDDKPSYYDFANKTRNMTGAEVFAAFAGSQANKVQAKG
jgi:hypothetical protein